MEGISVQETLFLFLGGLGIFLFGIKYMGDGLEKAAGDRLRLILDRLTTNPVMGVIAGILTTVLIQSSSGTTVLVVGFVNAGLMTSASGHRRHHGSEHRDDGDSLHHWSKN